MPGVRRASRSRPLELHFPSSGRRGWSREQRLQELQHWEQVAAAPDGELRVAALALDHLTRVQTWRDERIRELEAD